MAKKIKSKRTMKANLYETDCDELIYSSSARISATKPETKIKTKPDKRSDAETVRNRASVFGPSISNKSVQCTCNKCGQVVYGTLVSLIFSEMSGLVTPFVSYTCTNCNHSGHRSVREKMLPPQEFEALYF